MRPSGGYTGSVSIVRRFDSPKIQIKLKLALTLTLTLTDTGDLWTIEPSDYQAETVIPESAELYCRPTRTPHQRACLSVQFSTICINNYGRVLSVVSCDKSNRPSVVTSLITAAHRCQQFPLILQH